MKSGRGGVVIDTAPLGFSEGMGYMILVDEVKDIQKEFHDLMIEVEFMNKGYILGKMCRFENKLNALVEKIEKSEDKQ